MLNLNEAELSNLIMACKTSSLRNGREDWQKGLDAIAAKLYEARSELDRGTLHVDHVTVKIAA